MYKNAAVFQASGLNVLEVFVSQRTELFVIFRVQYQNTLPLDVTCLYLLCK